ncbi:MAG: AAA family ATPase, partial [Spirulina sp.]
ARVASPPTPQSPPTPLSKGGEGGAEMMLVAGFSGIGKTAVINEVHKPIVKQRGYFIKGKYDQLNRNIPFSAFVQAFRDLMAQLFGESDADLARWKEKILNALGENGQVIVDVIPELERIIGTQPPVSELSGNAAQNRFNLLFGKFVRVFTTKEHPLVIFLDDLQWVDSASLKLLELLAAESEAGYLLVLGAYRDNEVFPAHPLMLALEEIEKQGATLNTLTLEPLGDREITRLVADTLRCSLEIAAPLSQLVYQKTRGNPFFTTQFLQGLHEDGWITFATDAGYWQCDLTRVRQLALTDDVVAFMVERLRKLPEVTQEMLKLAACTGNQFDLETLAIVSERTSEDAAADLWEALQEGLLLPVSEAYKFFQGDAVEDRPIEAALSVSYRFLHDRVQQAAYTLIPEAQKQATHLKIGRLWLDNTAPEKREENIFAIVNQLNIGVDLIRDRAQTEELMRLNRTAGRKATTATAYEAAIGYFTLALNLLAPEDWARQYDLAFSLHLEASKAEYLAGNFPRARDLADIALKRAQSLLEQIDAYEQKIQIYLAQTQLQEALDTGLHALELLGVSLETDPPEKLDMEVLRNLPPMRDPEQLAVLQILNTLSLAALLADPSLSVQAVITGLHYCLQHGNSALAASPYSWYGTILCSQGEIETGYQLGQLAVDLLEQFEDRSLRSMVLTMFHATIQHWQDPIRDTCVPLVENFYGGLENGEVIFSGYSIDHYCSHLLFAGESLELAAQKHEQYGELLQNQKLEYHVIYLRICQQAILNLLGLSDDSLKFVGSALNEAEILPILVEQKAGTALFMFYVAKALVLYVLNEPERALACAREAAPYQQTSRGFFSVAEHNFYYSLALLACCPSFADPDRDEFLRQVTANQTEMQTWAARSPGNHQHKFDLVEAERYRVMGKAYQAMEYYDRAIAGAKEHAYIQEESLANELTAKFYLDWGKEKIAAGYMQEAYYGYARWGAKAKIDRLEEEYPQLLTPILQQQRVEWNTLESFTQTLTAITHTQSSKISISDRFDLTALLQAAQAFSRTIELEALLGEIAGIILTNSGAQKAVLLISQGEAWQVRGSAQITGDGTVETQTRSLPIAPESTLPMRLIQYVQHTLEPVAIDEAQTEISGILEGYLLEVQPQSVLCVPLLNQGNLVAILYLEHPIAKGVFTRDRQTIVQFLCSQAAIALYNAQLYDQAQQTLQDLKQAQLQLIQSEKMSALGNLVAGVAHEINNPTGFLQGNIEPAQNYVQDLLGLIDLYQSEYPQPKEEITDEIEAIDLEFIREDLPKLLDSMNLGVNRIRSISHSLRTFSRKDRDRKTSFNIHDGIDSTLLILKHRTKANERQPALQIVKDYKEIPSVKCFAGQLNQVFMNILANAIDAFEEANRDKTYSEIEANPNCITICTSQPDENRIQIQIQDNGCGMKSETLERIFEQGFTTKEVGKGTGLGMAIAHQIVTEKHGGTITCHSTLGQGTTFTIALPIF